MYTIYFQFGAPKIDKLIINLLKNTSFHYCLIKNTIQKNSYPYISEFNYDSRKKEIKLKFYDKYMKIHTLEFYLKQSIDNENIYLEFNKIINQSNLYNNKNIIERDFNWILDTNQHNYNTSIFGIDIFEMIFQVLDKNFLNNLLNNKVNNFKISLIPHTFYVTHEIKLEY